MWDLETIISNAMLTLVTLQGLSYTMLIITMTETCKILSQLKMEQAIEANGRTIWSQHMCLLIILQLSTI